MSGCLIWADLEKKVQGLEKTLAERETEILALLEKYQTLFREFHALRKKDVQQSSANDMPALIKEHSKELSVALKAFDDLITYMSHVIALITAQMNFVTTVYGVVIIGLGRYEKFSDTISAFLRTHKIAYNSITDECVALVYDKNDADLSTRVAADWEKTVSSTRVRLAQIVTILSKSDVENTALVPRSLILDNGDLIKAAFPQEWSFKFVSDNKFRLISFNK